MVLQFHGLFADSVRHPLLRYLRFWRAWISVLAPLILIAIPLSYTKQDTDDGKEDGKKPSIEKLYINHMISFSNDLCVRPYHTDLHPPVLLKAGH